MTEAGEGSRIEIAGKYSTLKKGVVDIVEPNQPIGKLLKELVDISTVESKMQRDQYELMRGGYEGFFHAERVRAYVNPEQFDAALPKWYKDLDKSEQDEIRTRMWINYAAAIKRDKGMAELDTVMNIGFRLEKRVLDHMWRNTPGFRVVLATVIHDVFDPRSDHLIITGKNVKRDNEGNVEEEATGGYRYVGSEEKLAVYKKQLTKGLTAYLEPRRSELEEKYEVSLELLAQSTVSFVDNLLFFLTLFMPGIKGESKWLKGSGSKAKEKGIAEERFGGPLGKWMRVNVRLFSDFKEELEKIVENREKSREGGEKEGEEKEKQIPFLIPDRLCYSLLDQTYFEDEKTSLSQKLLHTEKEGVIEVEGVTMQDFKKTKDGKEIINLLELGSSDIFGGYIDTRSAALKIFKHLTSDKADDRIQDPGVLVDALFKARKDPMLNKIYREKYLVLASLINMISPNGLVLGTQELVLNMDESTYDADVYNALMDSRLYEGINMKGKGTFRSWVLKELHAEDMARFRLGYILTTPSKISRERKRIRRKALRIMERQSFL